MKTGLVSITFRSFTRKKIVELCEEEGLSCVEWGGDIHVPVGDFSAADEAAELCRTAGINPVGYGSYYNAADDIEKFIPNFETAKRLGTQYVRIWAGKSCEYDETVVENVKKAVEIASESKINVSLECHRKTMTENVDFALNLVEKTGCRLHFQPNPDIGFEDNLKILGLFSPYLTAVHVFSWEKGPRGDVRLPLSAHLNQWRKYVSIAPDVPFLLEFVEADSEISFRRDAATLKKLEK